MSWLRLDPTGGTYGGKKQYEGLCEKKSDLDQEESDGYASYNGSKIRIGAGSLILCAETGAVHTKTSAESWTSIGEAESTDSSAALGMTGMKALAANSSPYKAGGSGRQSAAQPKEAAL